MVADLRARCRLEKTTGRRIWNLSLPWPILLALHVPQIWQCKIYMRTFAPGCAVIAGYPQKLIRLVLQQPQRDVCDGMNVTSEIYWLNAKKQRAENRPAKQNCSI